MVLLLPAFLHCLHSEVSDEADNRSPFPANAAEDDERPPAPRHCSDNDHQGVSDIAAADRLNTLIIRRRGPDIRQESPFANEHDSNRETSTPRKSTRPVRQRSYGHERRDGLLDYNRVRRNLLHRAPHNCITFHNPDSPDGSIENPISPGAAGDDHMNPQDPEDGPFTLAVQLAEARAEIRDLRESLDSSNRQQTRLRETLQESRVEQERMRATVQNTDERVRVKREGISKASRLHKASRRGVSVGWPHDQAMQGMGIKK